MRAALCLALATLCVSALAGDCTFRAGDVFSGRYRKTMIVPSLSESEVSFTFGPESHVIETNSITSTWSRLVQAGPNIVIQTLGQSPAINACPSSSIAKYELEWSDSCDFVTLEAVHDDCQMRTALFTTMVLTKETAPAQVSGECTLMPGTHWVGLYPERAQQTSLSGERVHVVVAPRGVMLEISTSGAIMTSHSITASSIHIKDIASPVADLRCPATEVGIYNVAFSEDCQEVTIKVNSEVCSGRLSRMDGLELVKIDNENAGSLVARASYFTTKTQTSHATTTMTVL